MQGPSESFGRNTTLATVLLAVIYFLRAVAPLDTLLVPFVPVKMTTVFFVRYPAAFEPVVFGAELLFLGAIGTTGGHLVHRWATDSQHAGWQLGVAGGLGIVALHWIKWGISFLGTTHTETAPVVVTGVSGVVLLGMAGWLARAEIAMPDLWE